MRGIDAPSVWQVDARLGQLLPNFLEGPGGGSRLELGFPRHKFVCLLIVIFLGI